MLSVKTVSSFPNSIVRLGNIKDSMNTCGYMSILQIGAARLGLDFLVLNTCNFSEQSFRCMLERKCCSI